MHRLISFVIAPGKLKKGGEVGLKPSQSAPEYYESSLPRQFAVSEESANVLGHKVKFLIRSYPPEHVLVEAALVVEDIFSKEILELRRVLVQKCASIAQKTEGQKTLTESYSIGVITGYQGEPEQFLNRKKEIAAFLKSENDELDEKEIDYTLEAQIKYGKNDLVVVDWDGAFIFDSLGEVEEVVDLLQIANLQLLRYRTLDLELDKKLKRVANFTSLPSKRTIWRKELAKEFGEIVRLRSQAIADFESIDRDIKLIGDWYPARLYELASRKFKLESWRKVVREKLESLEDIYDIVSENFSISRNEYLEFIQIALFFVLQIGWFALIILEFFYFTR